MANEQDYVELGLSCADICEALKRGMDRKKLDDLNKSMRDAITKLTMRVGPATSVFRLSTYPRSPDRRTVAEIQNKVIKRSGRSRASRFLHARIDKDAIAAWKSDLSRLLQVFNVGSAHSWFIAATDSLPRPS